MSLKRPSPIGHYRDGRPLWPIAGGDGTDGVGGEASGQGTGAGAAQGGNASTNGSTAGGTDGEFDKDRALATIQAQRTSEATAKADAKAAQERAEAAEKKLADLEAASKTDQEKAIDEAKKLGSAEAEAKYQAQIRRVEVRRALTASGVQESELDLAAAAPDFVKLDISADGDVKGLAEAVETFKKAHPALFAAKRTAGSADGGRRDSAGSDDVAPGPGRLRRAYAEKK